MLVSVIAAVKEVGITKYQEQHLVLLITKKLEELDLWSCHEVALRFLSTAAHIHSVLYCAYIQVHHISCCCSPCFSSYTATKGVEVTLSRNPIPQVAGIPPCLSKSVGVRGS